MEKSILAKRKAQKLARDGQVQQAIEEMRRLLGEAEVDPYDHVYLGDLLMRIGEREEGIGSYMEAIREYERVGLFRNAIAIGKKVLRIDAQRAKIQRNLGELYDREGLKAEAVPHYIAFLDSFSGENLPPEDFYNTLERAAAISGLQVEVALRLADHWIRVRQGERAAEYLYDVADRLEVEGGAEMAIELRRRASEACGGTEPSNALPTAESALEASMPQTPPVTLEAAQHFAEPSEAAPAPPSKPSPHSSAFEFDLEDLAAPAPASETSPALSDAWPAAELPAGSPSAEESASSPFTFDLDYGLGSRQDEPAPEPEGDAHAFELEPAGLDAMSDDSTPASSETGSADTSDALAFDFGADVSKPSPEPVESAHVADAETFAVDPLHLPEAGLAGSGGSASDEHVFEIEETEVQSDAAFVFRPVGETLSPREEAEEAFAAARFDEARGFFQKLHREHPNDPEILTRLVEIARKQKDHDGEALYLGLLGDAWIQDGDLERASSCFEQVLVLDPENSTAKRRVGRFRELGVLSEHAAQEPAPSAPAREAEPEIPPGVLGLGNSLVSVRNENPTDAEKEEWLDLEGLLEEFKAGLKNHMDASDFQGHYDLALSHHQMGLLEEALEELDRVFACPELPAAVAQPARELRGLCLTGLQRGREAVHEFREAFDQAPEGNGRRTSLYHLAKALEAVEEWQEASEKFELLLSEAPGFLDADERLKHCQAMAGQGAEHRPAA